MIELAILGLLTDQELHGYELKKRLSELLGVRSGVSFGSLYPALARLEKAGAVKAVEANEAPTKAVPLTGSLGAEVAAFRSRVARPSRGRKGRKVYGITDLGRERLHELLTDDSDGRGDDRTFALRVAFCGHLAPAERLALFERRRAELRARLHELERAAGDGTRGNDGYLRSLRAHDAAALRHDVAWVDELLEQERNGGFADEIDITADGAPAGSQSPQTSTTDPID
jgi:DNA-binding PadR family transcriptional regulator